MEKIWTFFLKNRQFSYIIVIALIFFGGIGLFSIPRESSPEVRVPVAVITTIFPGASAIDVEELVTNEIEDQLEGTLESVKKITSTSREGVSSIVVEFQTDADLDISIADTKDEVDKVKPDLPSDAEDPVVSDVDFSDEPIMTISLISDLPIAEVIDLVDDVESEIKALSGVSKIETSGVPEREVQVIVSQEALQKFNVRLIDIVRSIESANASLPAGAIELDGAQYTVAFEGSIEDPSAINNIAITNQGGQPVYIRDIAFVSDGVSDLATLARTSINSEPSEPAVSLSVFKRSGGDVTRISDAVREKLEALSESGELLADTPYLISFDNGEFVKDDLKNLSRTALQTILLVVIILLIAIGWKEALIAGLAIPLSFVIAFIGLDASGNTINFVSLFSLILSVGILVDSAIVVTEAIHTKMKAQQEKEVAAANTIKEFHYPLTTGTLTTIAVFAPLFLVTGVSGQFIAVIPFTIIFVLVASLIVALAFVPLFASKILTRRARSKMEEKQAAITERFQNWYRSFLERFLSNRKSQNRFLAGMIIAFVVVLSFPFTGLVKVIFFDQEDIDFLFIEIEKPQGTVLSQTDLSVREVEEIILGKPDVDSYIAEVGRGSQFGSGGVDEKLGSITLILDKERKRTSSEMVEDLRRDLSVVSSADVTISQPNDGPPTGAPILVKFFGDDLDAISVAVNQAERILEGISGTTEINTSTKTDASEFTLTVDRAKANQFGLDSGTIAFTLRTALFGTDATTIKSNGENIDVLVKLDLNQNFTTPDTTNRTTIDAIENIEITTLQGPVLLGSVLTTQLERSNEVIDHENRDRIGTVSAQIEKGANAREVLAQFNALLADTEMPTGVRMEIGGETEESNQAFKEMGLSLIVGVIAILAILVLQFASYRHALYIIIIVPFSLIGVFVGLALSGKALSFPSMMGFIALSGIVVNNAIILIDRMNKLRKENPDDIKRVVIEGAVSRLRPIILTTVTTVIGIIPLTYASDLWSPLAFSIIFGLSFAVIVTLILVPMLYFRWPGKKR